MKVTGTQNMTLCKTQLGTSYKKKEDGPLQDLLRTPDRIKGHLKEGQRPCEGLEGLQVLS